ncbi:hypothetical protein G6011_05965 [Alternaria panax]|uniref:Uncharacterized protein n=1 Tax=Alternaria panax TaxID=48097 RepID=A0AAD4FFH0_9PLEO|nr:hypothetical protein G6011_05965 [Alternaria panax]
MTDTRAETLTKKLKKEFGHVPSWKVSSTQTLLDGGFYHWNIRRMYCGWADDYNKFRPLAKTLHRACKKDIGAVPGITEDTIKRWISVDILTDREIMAKYQLQFDQDNPKMRLAKKLLAELRRDEGECQKVSELHTLRWVEEGLHEEPEAVREKYRRCIRDAKAISRAYALQYRLQDEPNGRPVASVAELQVRFHENLDDNAIVQYYRDRVPKPPQRADAPAPASLPAGAAN